jgi:Ca-activated chloride channel family protein
MGEGMMTRLVLAAASAVGVAASQAPQPIFRAQSEQVAVYATVRDRTGAIVRGLTKDDFEVRDNGAVRDVTTFSNDVQPITLAMVLDRSGSLALHASQVTAASLGFFDALLPDDRVSLSSLTWDCVGLTQDLDHLRRVVVAGMPMDSGSPIWDSIDRTFFALASEAGRRAILVFSDGSNSGMSSARPVPGESGGCRASAAATGATRQEVAARAERNGVLVYAVGVETLHGRQDGELQDLARNTGGELFRMKAGESLTTVFARIADELHHQYLFGFIPVARDGASRRIDVRVKRPGLTVRARRNYSIAAAGPAAPAALLDPGPPTDAAVAAAIADGLSGKALRASCLTPVTATGTYFEVAFEGPLGRIMRAAREAWQRGDAFGVSSVDSRLRAATVRVTATPRAVLPADPLSTRAAEEAVRTPGPPLTSPAQSFAAALRLRSLGERPVVLDPVLDVTPRMSQGARTSEFDLAAFRRLGDIVEAIVHKGVGETRCRLNRRAIDQVR